MEISGHRLFFICFLIIVFFPVPSYADEIYPTITDIFFEKTDFPTMNQFSSPSTVTGMRANRGIASGMLVIFLHGMAISLRNWSSRTMQPVLHTAAGYTSRISMPNEYSGHRAIWKGLPLREPFSSPMFPVHLFRKTAQISTSMIPEREVAGITR
jgi:hypothetical protein